jgi:hypothetical protein
MYLLICNVTKAIFMFVFVLETGLTVAYAGFELLILLHQPPLCWNYKCVPPHPLDPS